MFHNDFYYYDNFFRFVFFFISTSAATAVAIIYVFRACIIWKQSTHMKITVRIICVVCIKCMKNERENTKFIWRNAFKLLTFFVDVGVVCDTVSMSPYYLLHWLHTSHLKWKWKMYEYVWNLYSYFICFTFFYSMQSDLFVFFSFVNYTICDIRLVSWWN